jgi:hypothetical protein
MRGTGPVLQTVDAFFLVALQPAVINLPADAVVATRRCDVTADFLDMPQHGELVFCPTLELPLGRRRDRWCHGIFLPKGRPDCQQPPSVS